MDSKQKITTRISAIELFCPVSGNAICGPYSGSHLWSREDCEIVVSRGSVECYDCQDSHPVPSAAKTLAKR